MGQVQLGDSYRAGETRSIQLRITATDSNPLPTSGVTATWSVRGTDSTGSAEVTYDGDGAYIDVVAPIPFASDGLTRVEFTISGIAQEAIKPLLTIPVSA